MNDRWKHQVKTGLPWGIFMTVLMALFQMKEKPLLIQLNDGQFYFRLVCFLLFGVFVLGYSSWKALVNRRKKG